MKAVYVILAILTTSFFACQSTHESAPSGEVILTAEVGSVWTKDSTWRSIGAEDSSIVMDVRMVLTNQTMDTVHFRSMSCSYPEEFLVSDSTEFKILPSICFSNVPYTVSIPPNHATDRLIKVARRQSAQQSAERFQIGYKLHGGTLDGLTLWSKAIQMDRLYNQTYKTH